MAQAESGKAGRNHRVKDCVDQSKDTYCQSKKNPLKS